MNCMKVLSADYPEIAPQNDGFKRAAKSFNSILSHWKEVAKGFTK